LIAQPESKAAGKDGTRLPSFLHRTDLWITGILLVICGLLFYDDLDEDRSTKVERITFITAAGLLFVVTLSEWLGTDLSMVLSCVLLPMLWGERRIKIIIPFAIIFPLAVRIVFVEALNVHFLPGILEPILD
jgi:hypothetical protein